MCLESKIIADRKLLTLLLSRLRIDEDYVEMYVSTYGDRYSSTIVSSRTSQMQQNNNTIVAIKS